MVLGLRNDCNKRWSPYFFVSLHHQGELWYPGEFHFSYSEVEHTFRYLHSVYISFSGNSLFISFASFSMKDWLLLLICRRIH